MSEMSAFAPAPATPVFPAGGNLKLNLTTEFATNADTAIVYCRGRIVYRHEAAAVSALVADLPQTKHFVLDLSGVEMIDSGGLGELLAVHHTVQARGGSMKLAAPAPRVLGLLRLTNLVSVFEVHPSLADGLRSLGGQAG